ncbi:MAG: hypothetical protein ACRES9_10100 [Gammaproteobacteria bacterium]
MKLTTTHKIIVALDAIALLCCIVGLAGVIFSPQPTSASNLGNEPRVMALAAIGIFVLAVWAYLHWLKASEKNNRKVSLTMKIAVLPVALVAGLGVLILPVLFTPAFAPTIWLALLIVTSLLSITLILNPKTRRYFIK